MTAVHSPIPTPTRIHGDHSPLDDFVDRIGHAVPRTSPGPLVALFQSIISLGLLQLILWPTRWAIFVQSERRDLLDLANWWRRRVDGKPAAQLDQIARRFRPRPMLMVLPWLTAAFNVGIIGVLFMQGDSPRRIWDLTLGHTTSTHMQTLTQWHPFNWNDRRSPHFSRVTTEVNDIAPPALPLEMHLNSIWIFGLGIAYLCHWYAVRSHTVAVNSLAKWTNRIARDNEFDRIKCEATKLSMNPLWPLVGIALCTQQAWWAIPMVFTGSLQQRYITKSSPAIRLGLAAQARDGFAMTRSGGDHFCTYRNCGARMPQQARFCPRCGTPA